MTDDQDEGVKDDAAKARMDLIPPEFLFGTAAVLTVGAVEYGERNWEKGMRWGRPFSAIMRHMWAWWRGEKLDPKSGLPHLWHAACELAFLVAYEQRQIGTDDRHVLPTPMVTYAPRRASLPAKDVPTTNFLEVAREHRLKTAMERTRDGTGD